MSEIKTNDQILADKLGCDRLGICDRLFPISKGYTEKERFENVQAIMAAMSEVRYCQANFQVLNSNTGNFQSKYCTCITLTAPPIQVDQDKMICGTCKKEFGK